MIDFKESVFAEDRKSWRNWLKNNHDKKKIIWLVYYKKATKKPSVAYSEAVEEALCYGWIDSTVKRIDNEKYCQKFTPRNDKSVWSNLNKSRVEKLIKKKKMTKYGLEKVKIAKLNGMWDKAYPTPKVQSVPPKFYKVLEKNKKAKLFFDSLSPSNKKNYFNWIGSAKRQETIDKRIKKAISLLAEGKKLGLK